MITVIVAIIAILILNKICPSFIKGLAQFIRVCVWPIMFGIIGAALLNVIGAVIGVILGIVLAVKTNRKHNT